MLELFLDKHQCIPSPMTSVQCLRSEAVSSRKVSRRECNEPTAQNTETADPQKGQEPFVNQQCESVSKTKSADLIQI